MLRCSARCCIYEYHFGQPSLSRAFRANLQPATWARLGPYGEPLVNSRARPAVARSTLSNGVRVVSCDLQEPHAAIGFYADAGPKYDPLTLPGLSHVMRVALLTSSMEDSLFQLDRTMRASGTAYGHSELNKRHLCWRIEGRRDGWERPFAMLATNIAAPRFHEADIERFRDTMDNQLEELRWQRPRDYAVDQLETVAFYKEPLGSPRMVPQVANDRCNAQALLEHWAALFQPSRLTIAGVNVPHEALVAAYERLPYKHSAAAPHHARAVQANGEARLAVNAEEAAQFYQGKERLEQEARAAAMGTQPDMEPEVIVAVGVASYGREAGVRDYATALVTREVYGRAVARTYAIPHTSVEDYHGAQVFYRPYSTVGLIGFTVRARPAALEEQLRAVCAHFPRGLTDRDVAHACQCARLRLLHDEAEMTRDYCDFLATSPTSLEELLQAIADVRKEHVEKALVAMLAQKPSVFATGETFVLPRISALNKL